MAKRKQIKKAQKKLGQMEVGASESQEKSVKKQQPAKISPVVEDIIKRVDSKEVNLFYAIEGYCLEGGRPIMSYGKVIETLTTYGYDIESVLDYLDYAAKQDEGPIIMQSKDMSFMYSEVQKIPAVEKVVRDYYVD